MPPSPAYPIVLVASRFGLLVSLAVWTGLAVSVLLLAQVLAAKLERPQSDEVAQAVFQRADQVLLGAIVLLGLALAARAWLDRSAPAGMLLLPIAVMVGSRLCAAFALAPALRALRGRMLDANAPASESERAAFRRLHGAWILLLALEACLGLYALFSIS